MEHVGGICHPPRAPHSGSKRRLESGNIGTEGLSWRYLDFEASEEAHGRRTERRFGPLCKSCQQRDRHPCSGPQSDTHPTHRRGLLGKDRRAEREPCRRWGAPANTTVGGLTRGGGEIETIHHLATRVWLPLHLHLLGWGETPPRVC